MASKLKRKGERKGERKGRRVAARATGRLMKKQTRVVGEVYPVEVREGR